MKKLVGVLAFVLAGCPGAYARDGFDKVRCGADIAKALIGQGMTDGPVAEMERRHKDLALKDLGASDYGSFSSITWMICGKEYMVLESTHTNIVRDVLQLPPHTRINPAFEGTCKRDGKPMSGSVVAILRDDGGQNELVADSAWNINEKSVKFDKVSTAGMLCPRDGILEPVSQP